MKQALWLATFALCICASCSTQSQGKIDDKHIADLVDEIGTLFSEEYTFPKKGKRVQRKLTSYVQAGRYAHIHTYDSLATSLKRDIDALIQDKHVAFRHYSKSDASGSADEPDSRMHSFFREIENYGLTQVEILEGGMGYVKIPVFVPMRTNANVQIAVDRMIDTLRHCRAIVFDLRECVGGDASLVAYIISYLYSGEQRVHLNDFYYRPTNTTSSSFTSETVGTDRIPDMPVYALTSGQTFSAGEEFAYDLKHLGRAQIIGEVTGGGAHTVEPRRLNPHFEMMLPTGRAINPITKTNWEGVGVQPDIAVPADDALEKVLGVIRGVE